VLTNPDRPNAVSNSQSRPCDDPRVWTGVADCAKGCVAVHIVCRGYRYRHSCAYDSHIFLVSSIRFENERNRQFDGHRPRACHYKTLEKLDEGRDLLGDSEEGGRLCLWFRVELEGRWVHFDLAYQALASHVATGDGGGLILPGQTAAILSVNLQQLQLRTVGLEKYCRCPPHWTTDFDMIITRSQKTATP